MRPGGGKAKGSGFERKVCVALSQWVSKGEREDLFWRSAMSGGRATVRGKKGKKADSQLGDISCVHHSGSEFLEKLIIECKFVKDLNLKGAVFGKGPLAKFWWTLAHLAQKHKRIPVLIAKQNNLPILLVMRPGDAAMVFAASSRHMKVAYHALDIQAGAPIAAYELADVLMMVVE